MIPRTPAEVAAATDAERAEWAHRTVAHLRAVAAALHTAGVPGYVAIGNAARTVQGAEAAWRAAATACCERAPRCDCGRLA